MSVIGWRHGVHRGAADFLQKISTKCTDVDDYAVILKFLA